MVIQPLTRISHYLSKKNIYEHLTIDIKYGFLLRSWPATSQDLIEIRLWCVHISEKELWHKLNIYTLLKNLAPAMYATFTGLCRQTLRFDLSVHTAMVVLKPNDFGAQVVQQKAIAAPKRMA